MRQLLPVIALVAGCSFDHGALNRRDASTTDVAVVDAASDGSVDAPGDASTGVGDSAVDAPVSLDTDNDGVLDVSDNCPTVSNANQRNHDADAKGDACDRCPHLPDSADPDGDNDGVGDACDPRPTTAGDSIAIWQGFYDSTATTGWVGTGTWSVNDGRLVQSATTAGVSSIGPTTTYPRVAITSHVRVIAFGTPNTSFNSPAVSVVGGVVGNGQAYYCSAVATQSGNRIYSTAIWASSFEIEFTPWSGTFAPASELLLTETLSGSTMTCRAMQGATVANAPAVMVGPIEGAVRLSTTTASASFDYLFVVAIGA